MCLEVAWLVDILLHAPDQLLYLLCLISCPSNFLLAVLQLPYGGKSWCLSGHVACRVQTHVSNVPWRLQGLGFGLGMEPVASGFAIQKGHGVCRTDMCNIGNTAGKGVSS